MIRDVIRSKLSSDPNIFLETIHNHIQLKHGNMLDEYPEQIMTSMFLDPRAKVLELGGCLGRNSIVIASILNDDRNLVVVECLEENIPKIIENRNNNGFNFHIETSAISDHRLVQRGWLTIPSDIDIDGFNEISTISYDELYQKYKINFDTIVADCEGAMYYILKDNPEILSNINTFIVENDYRIDGQREYVESLLLSNGLVNIYNAPHPWPEYAELKPWFFQVWKKPI